MTTQPDIDGIRRQIAATIHAHWKLVLAQGILLMIFGLLAVAMPNIATLAVEIVVGWLFFIAGIFRAVSVWQARQMPGFGWSMLSAFRDDYRQHLASGLKAGDSNSLHGGKARTGGYGHGQATGLERAFTFELLALVICPRNQ